jgi:phosphatidate phosphatase APP1
MCTRILTTASILITAAILFALASNIEFSQGAGELEENETVSEEKPTSRSDIRSDEHVVFYPTYGYLGPDRKIWSLPIHGIIYEPEEDSLRRGALVASIRKGLGLKAGESESETFNRRIRLFLVDNEGGKDIFIRIGDRVFEVGTSEANGHFRGKLRLADADIDLLLEKGEADDGILSFEAVTRGSDTRRFPGRVNLIGPTGLSIISDIDDTIKHSQVGDHKALLANTFLRKFKPVPGMPELYRQCADKGIVFHYVSGSPWQLYLPLAEFLEAERLPEGSFHLKQFRLKDRSMLGLLQSQEATKLAAIEPILAAYPDRQFILIGDSGEQDPEIYAKVAQRHGGQVAAIFIRNVTGETIDNARFRAVRQQLDDVQFQLFEEPDRLLPIIEGFDHTGSSPEP